jgi:hypothetical protein
MRAGATRARRPAVEMVPVGTPRYHPQRRRQWIHARASTVGPAGRRLMMRAAGRFVT